MKLDYSEAHEKFSLNVESGILSWKIQTGSRALIGAEAGWKSTGGYRYVSVQFATLPELYFVESRGGIP